MKNTEGVGEAGMCGTGINEAGQTELLQAPQSLKRLRVHQLCLNPAEGDLAVDGVGNDSKAILAATKATHD